MLTCRFCERNAKNKNSAVNHERMCSSNPDRKPPARAMAGKIPWNKGLTKETNVTIAEQALKIQTKINKAISEGRVKGFSAKGFWTPERRLAKSEEKKKLYIEHPEKHPNRKLAGNRLKMTYPEQVAFDWLTKNSIKFEHQVAVKLDGRMIYPDFALENMIIEIDGKFWHNEAKDKSRDDGLARLGFDVHRIKACERIEQRLEQIFLL